jgi:hypothetical protein
VKFQYQQDTYSYQSLAGLNGANPSGSSGYLPLRQPYRNSWAHPLSRLLITSQVQQHTATQTIPFSISHCSVITFLASLHARVFGSGEDQFSRPAVLPAIPSLIQG